jgi:hypothetical protein
VWKRSYGRPTKAPPDERGGNRHGRPNTTAPHPDSTHCSPSRRRPRMAASEREGDGAATSLNVGFPIENPTYVVASGGRSWSQAPTAGLRSLTGPCWRVRHRQPCAVTGRSRGYGSTGQIDPQETFVPRQRIVGPARKRSFVPDRRPCLRQDHVSSSSSAFASFRSAVPNPSVNQP